MEGTPFCGGGSISTCFWGNGVTWAGSLTRRAFFHLDLMAVQDFFIYTQNKGNVQDGSIGYAPCPLHGGYLGVACGM